MILIIYVVLKTQTFTMGRSLEQYVYDSTHSFSSLSHLQPVGTHGGNPLYSVGVAGSRSRHRVPRRSPSLFVNVDGTRRCLACFVVQVALVRVQYLEPTTGAHIIVIDYVHRLIEGCLFTRLSIRYIGVLSVPFRKAHSPLSLTLHHISLP